MGNNIKKKVNSHMIDTEKNELIKWVKLHKKELFLAGVGIMSLIGIILGLKHRESIKELWFTLQKNISKPTSGKLTLKMVENPISVVERANRADIHLLPTPKENRTIFDVTGHVRNLHKGWNASPEKMAEATALGVNLLQGQTWVDSYTKGIVAA